MLLTLAGTIGAIVLAIYFLLRRRYLLALVCLACFFALLRPGVVYGTQARAPVSPADGQDFNSYVQRMPQAEVAGRTPRIKRSTSTLS